VGLPLARAVGQEPPGVPPPAADQNQARAATADTERVQVTHPRPQSPSAPPSPAASPRPPASPEPAPRPAGPHREAGTAPAALPLSALLSQALVAFTTTR
jgi:hypothetical protein